jgi:hypothetical protein
MTHIGISELGSAIQSDQLLSFVVQRDGEQFVIEVD